jgi:hypothetical protein
VLHLRLDALPLAFMQFIVFLTGGWNVGWLGRKAASFDRRVNGREGAQASFHLILSASIGPSFCRG